MSEIILKEIDIAPFVKALGALKKAYGQTKDEYIRDSCIKRFEFTFELAWKTLKRFLKYKGIDALGSKDVIRFCAREGLILDPQLWFSFVEDRNRTSHTYEEDASELVYGHLEVFIPEMERILQVIRELKE
jgi:nucleotidyltransferase substrate binding protein (TIGR01987 family)